MAGISPTVSDTPAMNRLGREASPYLRQHASNPVDWYPWCPEALARACELDRPIFLSIGYSACHWCHVMERESFTNAEIAAVLNEHFVPIKVDREEQPELDDLYMQAVQSLTGTGGWPLSVFLTPGLTPFYGGTYYPPHSAYGRPGFLDVVAGIARGWASDRDRAVEVGRKLEAELRQEAGADTRGTLDERVLDRSLEGLAGNFDTEHGGFGSGAKFPHATDVLLCLRHAQRLGQEGDVARHLALRSLAAMADGGLWDHLGGGFHRYCVDERWLVPHFEKMLYDNALLVPVYLEAHLMSGSEEFAAVARATCDWMVREMTLSRGGFASSLDADSEGHEGVFYTWTPEELREVLGTERGYQAQEWFGVDDEGHLEDGRCVLHRQASPSAIAERLGLPETELSTRMADAASSLRTARRRRVAPERDDKVVVGWNGLAVSAMARAAQVLGHPSYLEAARSTARFLLEHLTDPEGGLVTTWLEGRQGPPSGLEGYAFLVQGLLDLYETDFDQGWLRAALDLGEVVEARFRDPEQGGYFTTEARRSDLLVRRKSPMDGALPAAGSVHALNLLRLAEQTGRRGLAERAQDALRAAGVLASRYPAGFSALLLAADFLASPPRELVLVGDAAHPGHGELLEALHRCSARGRVLAACAGPGSVDTGLQPILEGRSPAADGAPLVYPCQGYACAQPVRSAEELRAWLDA